MKTKYCSGLPTDTFNGADLKDCCKNHDNQVGQRGTYSLVSPTVNFYKCLEAKLSKTLAFIFAIFGLVGHIVKYPYLAYKIYKYRKVNNG